MFCGSKVKRGPPNYTFAEACDAVYGEVEVIQRSVSCFNVNKGIDPRQLQINQDWSRPQSNLWPHNY